VLEELSIPSWARVRIKIHWRGEGDWKPRDTRRRRGKDALWR
jgi:hypothetical protein